MKHTNVLFKFGSLSTNEGMSVTLSAVSQGEVLQVGTAAMSHDDITANQLKSTMVDKHLKMMAISQVVDALFEKGVL